MGAKDRWCFILVCVNFRGEKKTQTLVHLGVEDDAQELLRLRAIPHFFS